MHSSSKNQLSTGIATGLGISVALGIYYYSKIIRARWQVVEEKNYSHDTIPSIIEHFQDAHLDATSTVQEANRRRTVSYYQKARQAHSQSLVLGHTNYHQLVQRRRDEMERNLSYYNEGEKSHRTVLVMLDTMTHQILEEAREKILAPLHYSHDLNTRGVWIPSLNMIPAKDMHVTIAIPWWWHTMREGNRELSQALANRFRQALVLDFHHPFQIELERIILLGGKTLVALWRTIGERTTDDGTIIQDRHGAGIDPMVRLRREIVQCFTTENEEIGRKPLTYHAHKRSLLDGSSPFPLTPERGGQTLTETPSKIVPPRKNSLEAGERASATTIPKQPRVPKSNSLPAIPKPAPLTERQPTIEEKTPGLGQGDGFIHTTLVRLPPLNCLSMNDVELEPIHRLCREATATYAGHRMVISKFRFLETTGQGGESNPCVGPIFEETMDAPSRVVVDAVGQVSVLAPHETYNLPNVGSGQFEETRHATIGAPPVLNGGWIPDGVCVESLFDKPE